MNNMKEDTNKKIMTYYQLLFYFPCYSVHTTSEYKNETELEDKIYFIPELPKNGFGYLSELMNALEECELIYCVTDPFHNNEDSCQDFNYIGFTTDKSLYQEASFQIIDIHCNCMKAKSHEKNGYFLKEKSLFDVLQQIECDNIKFFQMKCQSTGLPSEYCIDVTKLSPHSFLIADIDKYPALEWIIHDGWITCEALAGNMYLCNINSDIIMVDKYMRPDSFTLSMLNESGEVYYWKASLPLLLGQILYTKMTERKKKEKEDIEVSSLSMSGTDMSSVVLGVYPRAVGTADSGFVKKPVYPRYYDMAFFIRQPGVGLTKNGIDTLLELIKYDEQVNLIEFTNKKINRCAIGFVTTDVYKRFQKDELFYEELKIFIANRLINFNEAISYEFDGLNIFIGSLKGGIFL